MSDADKIREWIDEYRLNILEGNKDDNKDKMVLIAIALLEACEVDLLSWNDPHYYGKVRKATEEALSQCAKIIESEK